MEWTGAARYGCCRGKCGPWVLAEKVRDGNGPTPCWNDSPFALDSTINCKFSLRNAKIDPASSYDYMK
jgi:hypothetical protein